MRELDEPVMSMAPIEIDEAVIQAAVEVARATHARAIFVYVHAVRDPERLRDLIPAPTELVLVTRDAYDAERAVGLNVRTLHVPAIDLSRTGQIKVATLMALTQQVLEVGDTFVFLAGPGGQFVDTLIATSVGRESELFQTVGQPKLTEHIRRVVFERVLSVAMELAQEGREGKPVGALFVIGDDREVHRFCQPGRLNPFKGYSEKTRNILEARMADTVKEMAKLDGAFIIKGNGVVVAAGAILRPALAGEVLPQGLGARHAAAAAITACTRSIAITISESTGTVRVWRRGSMITEIERGARVVRTHETAE